MIAINVIKLNEYLSDNVDAIVSLLEALELTEINYNAARHEVRCAREEGRNPSSVKIDTNTLYYNCFSNGRKGSIYTLIMDKLGKTFPQALSWAVQTLGLEKKQFNSSIKLPFGGYYKNILKEDGEPELSIPTYDESILRPYVGKYNMMFFRDGINYRTQEKFKVGYDNESLRITVPQWNVNGELVGVMGRLNSRDCPKELRWLPIISCPRSLTLYGYHMNYADIQQKRTCLLLESEKSVMQMDSMGYHFGLATCKNSISDTQAKYAKALMVENLIVGFDEGVEEEYIIESAKKLKIYNPLFKNRVGYIFDKNNELLPKGSKASPTDLGIKTFKRLMETKVKWLS